MNTKGLVQRRNIVADAGETKEAHSLDDRNAEEIATQETSLTLMEEILLLGIKDKEGFTSFWNDSISSGLRGCVLIELTLRGRIELEVKIPGGRKSLGTRRVVVKDDTPTGDALLDEALKHIKSASPPETAANWISYLSGETWNFFKLKYQLKNVRLRLAKNLSEKGILSTAKRHFYLFDVTTHPLANVEAKAELTKKLQNALLCHWEKDVKKFDKRLLALIVLSSASDVLENVLFSLNDENYHVAARRVRELLELDFQAESFNGSPSSDLYWAILSSLIQ